MFDVMVILRLNRVDHVDPPYPMTDEDISREIGAALSARFPKVIGYGPPATTLANVDGTKPRPSVVLALQAARVMVIREENLPEHVNGTAPVAPRVVE